MNYDAFKLNFNKTIDHSFSYCIAFYFDFVQLRIQLTNVITTVAIIYIYFLQCLSNYKEII